MLIKTNPRKGMILLVVVAFLAMFTVIGTTYLLLGDVARKTSEFDIQATDKKTAFQLMTDITPQYILNRALGQIIYDVQPLGFDGNQRLATENSSLRGHGLSSDIYGIYDPNVFAGTSPIPALSNNFYPFTGTGKDATEAANLMNYMSFGAPTSYVPPGMGPPPALIYNLYDPGSFRERPFAGLNTPTALLGTWNQPSTVADANHSYLGRYLYPNRLNITGSVTNGSDMITNVTVSSGSPSDLAVEMPIDFIVTGNDDNQVSAARQFPPLPFFIREINKTDPSNVTVRLNQTFLTAPTFSSTAVRNFVVTRFIPSFHRETVFGPMRTDFSVSPPISSTPTNTNAGNLNWLPGSWGPRTTDGSFVIDSARHRTLRPRPFDQLTAGELNSASGGFSSPRDTGFITALNTLISNNQIFPYPEADGMDVKNLEGYPGGNDSIWIDAGFPVMTTPDGRKYKVLIAPLILDLDGKVNLNVAGNLMLRNTDPSTNNRPNYYEFNANHGSNQGIGRWEINPQKLIANYGVPPFSSVSPPGHPFNPLSITQNPFPGGSPPIFQNEFLNLLSFKIPTDTSLPSSRTSPLVPAPLPLDDSFPYEPGTAGSDKAASLQGILSDYYRPLQLEIGRFYHPNFIPTISNYPKPDGFSATPSYFPYGSPTNIAAGSNIPHSYARVDFNAARDDANPPGPVAPIAPNLTPAPLGGLGTSARLDYSVLTTFGFPNFDIPDVLNSSYKGSNNSLDNLFTETRIKTVGGGMVPVPYHARYFNPYRSSTAITSDLSNISTVFPANETAALMRWTGKGELFQASKLARLMPKSLGLDMPYENTLSDGLFRHAVRNMVTTLSADLERPAMVPIDIDIGTNPTSRFAMDSTYGYPRKGRTGPIADSPSSTINRTTPALKLNLNRTLSNYPLFNGMEAGRPVRYDFTVAADRVNVREQYTAALRERQDFARDIFDYLKNVTGVAKMGSRGDLFDFPLTSPIFTDPAERTNIIDLNRWLAQLAVNIVDFIDNDDFNTQFQWDVNDPSRANEFLFGIEMPRLVINEVYVQARNPEGATDGAAAYEINTVVELLNPLPTDSSYDDRPGSHAALLQYDNAGTPVRNYKLSLVKRGNGASGTTAKTGNLRDEINRPKAAGTFETRYFGDLDDQPITVPADTGGIERLQLSSWQAASTLREITPGAYYIVGDSKTGNVTPAGSAPPAADYNSTDLDISCTTARRDVSGNGNCPQVVLQRLAVPGLPPEPNPASGVFNPYITVDVFSRGTMNDARRFDSADAVSPIPPLNTRLSRQRLTPFLDNRNQPINFDAGSSDNYSEAPHEFRGATGERFPMLVHLDRKLINPLELLNVACCFPHEFTQRATRWHTAVPEMVGGVNIDRYPYAANWPWFDENTRLYRFLEAVAVEPLQNGEALNGRSLGKININTMPHANVFHALCDGTETNYPSAANNFDRTTIETVYNRLKNKYTSLGQEVNIRYDDPNVLKGFQNSILGSLTPPTGNIIPARSQLDLDAYGVVTFSGTGDTQNQLARRELLSKIANSVTTKSNTFAVWITAGYFEVRDDTTQPPKLGAEIGKADGINIRHRMFAMIDRTHLRAADCLLRTAAGVVVNPPLTFNTDVDYDGFNNYFTFKNTLTPGVTGEWFPIPAGTTLRIRNPVSGLEVPATAGMILVLDPNTDYEETVQLEVVGGVAGFYVRKEHYPNRRPAALPLGRPQRYNSINTINSIIIRGNPGPWKNYDYRLDPLVVPYAEIIE